MCIRDSAYSAQQRAEHESHGDQDSIERNGQQERAPALGFCLLYTSDAADERSSVDLGGRRIIKKKKRKTQLLENDTHNQKVDKTRDTER